MRDPDIKINGDYLHRWYVIPRNPYFNIYVHKFMQSDEDRALHDHPWYSVSVLLKGEFIEHSLKGVRHIPRIAPVFRTAKFAHRLELVKGPAWTIFITGPRIREWGFLCPKGWRHWSLFTNSDGTEIGRGCE